MKKSIIYFFCLLPFLAKSQTTTPTTQNSGVNIFRNIFDETGKPVPPGTLSNIEGSPLLSNDWVLGTVSFFDGRFYNQVLLNFNLFTNELWFLRDSAILMFADPVREFSITYTENKLKKTARYRSGYTGTEKKSSKSFYEVLSEGPVIDLLNFRSRVIEEIVVYGSPVKKTYVAEDKLYIFDVKNKKLRLLSKGINSLIKYFPLYETLINQFVRDNELNMKEENSLILLVKYINDKSTGSTK